MNIDRILPVRKEHLLLMQVLCWLAPGIVILRKGILAMLAVAETDLPQVWWLMLVAAGVLVAFLLMFRGFVNRYTDRILNFPTLRKSLLAFFDLKGYVLIIFMMGLGVSLKYIPFLPVQFFAAFYPGLGTALAISGIRFFISWYKAIR